MSGNVVHLNKGVGFAWLISSHFSKISYKMKFFGLTEHNISFP